MPKTTSLPADTRYQTARWARVLLVLLGLIVGGIGLASAWFGLQLVWVGGTWYYLLAGVALALAGLALIAGQHIAGVRVQGLVVVATLIWSLWEIAAKGFLPAWGADLGARVGVLAALFIATALIRLMGTPPAPHAPNARRYALGGVAVLAVGAIAMVAVLWERPVAASAVADGAVGSGAGIGHGADDWLAFGGSPLAHRFTPASAITTANVADLSEAWRFQTGDLSPSDRVFFSAQNTPVLAGGRLFVCSPSNRVFALNPGTGEQLWAYDPQMLAEDMESLFSVACRGVGYFDTQLATTPLPGAEAVCEERVYVTTVASDLTALDAATGLPCGGFGTDGTVDLAENMDLQEIGFASSTSGVTVVGDALIVGQQVSDNQRRDAPSGVVRAYDAITGDLRWAWDAKLQGRAQDPLAPGEVYPRGTPNVWNIISGDPEANIVYLGTGNSANDHFGGDRTAEEDEFTAAVVAVDATTGDTIWSYATVIHDVWDYDIGAQPIVGNLAVDGAAERRVVIQGTKTGSLFVLDAATGEPVTPIEMKPAPQDGLPGERLSPDQPQSVFYPNLSGIPGPDPEVLNASHTFGLTPVDAAMCRLEFERMRYDGMYTPPIEGTMLLFPGTIGGMNWGGLGFDEERGILVTNHSRLPNIVRMIPRAEVDDLPVGMGGARPDQEVAPHYLSPWGVDRPIWLSPLEVPCIAPPWGIVAATDMRTGDLLWSQPLGTGFDSGPFGLPTFLKVPIGTANIGGPLMTATGLTFIAAAQDNWLRAFQTTTGRLLWEGRLPAGGQASPMSYEFEGRQYVVMTATGHQRLTTTTGDYVVAFALPD